MKKLLLTFTLLSCFIGLSQTITYYEVSSAKERIKGKFTEYISKDGSSYKIGDKIRIGVPSSNKTFAFITEGDGILLPVTNLSVTFSGTETEIKNIIIGGNKRTGFHIILRTKGNVGVPGSGYNINFENAVENGEVKSFGMSSDEALSELKKAKDKLDLGLITQEEYNVKKEELSKFIK